MEHGADSSGMAAGCIVPILVFCSAGHFAAQRRVPVGDESVYALDAPLSAGSGSAGGQFQCAGGGTADTAPLLRLCAAAGVGGEQLCRRADVAADAGRDFLHGGRRGSADYRIKGRFNEQNSKDIMQGASVIVKSRLDDSTWKGEITSVDTSPQKNSGDDIYSFGSSDEMSQSSNYAFYVKPENFDGLMLGQHVLIEIDNGQDTSINKTGIWLYSDFICKDGKKNYVWAKDKDGKIEKRYVEIGQKDEDNGDCEIKSGLEKGDYIAYPDKSIEEGMTATTNEADVSVPPNDLGTNDNSDADTEGGDEDIAFDGSGEDGMAIDEDKLASMTDEEIEEYFNKLYGEEENADGENADAADADAAFAE